MPEEGTLDRPKLPSAEELHRYLTGEYGSDDSHNMIRAYANAVLEAAAEVAVEHSAKVCVACGEGDIPNEHGYHKFASMNCTGDGYEIAAAIRKLKEEPSKR